MQSGAIDAGVTSSPVDIQARRLGMRELADLSRLDKVFYQTALVAARRVVDGRPDMVRRFMRAIVEANSVIQQDQARTKEIIGRYSETTDDEVLEHGYQVGRAAIPRLPLPTREAVEAL